MCGLFPCSQVKCFDSPLPTHALQEIKALVARNTLSGINEDGLTMEGAVCTACTVCTVCCVYCVYCVLCTVYCVYCAYCVYCVYCMYCVYCVYCMYCVYCAYCVYCVYCIAQGFYSFTSCSSREAGMRPHGEY